MKDLKRSLEVPLFEPHQGEQERAKRLSRRLPGLQRRGAHAEDRRLRSVEPALARQTCGLEEQRPETGLRIAQPLRPLFEVGDETIEPIEDAGLGEDMSE